DWPKGAMACVQPAPGLRKPADWSLHAINDGRYIKDRCRRLPGAPHGRPRVCRKGSEPKCSPDDAGMRIHRPLREPCGALPVQQLRHAIWSWYGIASRTAHGKAEPVSARTAGRYRYFLRHGRIMAESILITSQYIILVSILLYYAIRSIGLNPTVSCLPNRRAKQKIAAIVSRIEHLPGDTNDN